MNPGTVVVDGARVALVEDALLGEGGEGRVYRVGAEALKVFFAPSPLRARKLEAFPSGLPRAVVGPIRLARDPDTEEIRGYTMRLVEGGFDAGHLAERRFRERERVGNADVVRWVLAMSELLGRLHAAGVVVGDLNAGNVMLTRAASGAIASHLIDADSMQQPHMPCVVAHERYVHPDLYGQDLAARPWFSPASDYYALAVLAFESLLYLHPYGGVHSAHKTLARRAEARLWALGPDVKRPRAAAPADTLDDDWLGYFSAVFEQHRCLPPPPALGRARFSRCRTCGAEHARKTCPTCVAFVAASPGSSGPRGGGARAPARPQLEAVVVHDGGDAPVVAAAIVGGELAYAFVRDGRLVREGGYSMPMPDGPLRVELERRATWIVTGDAATRFPHDPGARPERFGADDPRGRNTFASAGGEALRVRDGFIERLRQGTRVGAVCGGRTAIFSGEQLAFAAYRVGGMALGFVFSPKAGGLRQVSLGAVGGRTTRAFARFDRDHVLFGLTLDTARGHLCRLHMFDREGHQLAFAEGAPETAALLADARGAALAGGALVVPSAEGVRLFRPEAGRFCETKTFPETAPFLGGSPELLVDDRGALYAVQFARIVRLTLTPSA